MKEALDLARESKLDIYGLGYSHDQFMERVKAFEALVRADAIADEREACILELERNADKTLEDIVAAIRARGNT
jgi:hypothetical protein